MTVAVIGSRDFADYDKLAADLDHARSVLGDFTVVSGGARGADRMAERWAKERGLPVQVFPADWERYGRSAGIRRNHDIINAADVVIAFWDGVSRGTAHGIGLAKKQGKKVYVRSFADAIRQRGEEERGGGEG